MGPIKGKKTDTGADVYESLADVHLSFDGFKVFEANSGDIILRGRNGMRDHLFPLDRAVQKYLDWMDLVYTYARAGIAGWSEAYDIAKEFRARIDEAVAQRKKLNRPIPENVEKLLGTSANKTPEH